MAEFLTLAEREARAQVIALAISSVMGGYPNVNREPETTVISLKPEQLKKAREYLSNWLRSGPSDVRVDIKPVVVPVILKQYWPLIVGIPVGAGVIGYILGRR